MNKELHLIKTFRKNLLAYFTNLKATKLLWSRKDQVLVYTTQTKFYKAQIQSLTELFVAVAQINNVISSARESDGI